VGKTFRIPISTFYINSDAFPPGSLPFPVPSPFLSHPFSPFHLVHPRDSLPDCLPTKDEVCYQRHAHTATPPPYIQMGRSFDVNVDPLAQITAPPVNETPEQRRVREHEEANARKVSEQIDEALKAEREEGKAKRKNRLKVLLLGQSESGASNFLLPSYRYPWSVIHATPLLPPPSATRISKFALGLFPPHSDFVVPPPPPLRRRLRLLPLSPLFFLID